MLSQIKMSSDPLTTSQRRTPLIFFLHPLASCSLYRPILCCLITVGKNVAPPSHLRLWSPPQLRSLLSSKVAFICGVGIIYFCRNERAEQQCPINMENPTKIIYIEIWTTLIFSSSRSLRFLMVAGRDGEKALLTYVVINCVQMLKTPQACFSNIY